MQSLHQVEIAGVAAGDRDGLRSDTWSGWPSAFAVACIRHSRAAEEHHGQARRLLRLAQFALDLPGVERFEAIARSTVRPSTIWPVDFGSVFAVSGGLPLPKRAPQRQAYRMMELKRWRDHLGVKLNLEPKHFPSNECRPPGASSRCASRAAWRCHHAGARRAGRDLDRGEKHRRSPQLCAASSPAAASTPMPSRKMGEAPEMAVLRESYTKQGHRARRVRRALLRDRRRDLLGSGPLGLRRPQARGVIQTPA
jgi:carboxymethylenebutenolidase